jgi:nicotinate-nucleotide adenylyltransferase
MHKAKIGVFGGTFDPIHNGHLSSAYSAGLQLGLDGVIFIPTGNKSPHKRRYATSAKTRLEMVKLAIEPYSEPKPFRPTFLYSDYEVNNSDISYTVDTLAHMREGVGKHCELFLLMGTDQAAELSTWKDPDRLFELSTVCVMSRLGYDIPDKWRSKLKLINVDNLNISSTSIRAIVESQGHIAHLVPEAVAKYITDGGLYQ